jgi:hypothetical protein
VLRLQLGDKALLDPLEYHLNTARKKVQQAKNSEHKKKEENEEKEEKKAVQVRFHLSRLTTKERRSTALT